MNKLTVAEMQDLEKQVSLGEISYSRMVEIINEKFTADITRFREAIATVQKIIQKPEPLSKSELICAIHPALNPSLNFKKCAICYCEIQNDVDGMCAECWSKK